MSDLFQSYQPYDHLVGTRHSVLVTDLSSDGNYYFGHNKAYVQVCAINEPKFENKSDKMWGKRKGKSAPKFVRNESEGSHPEVL